MTDIEVVSVVEQRPSGVVPVPVMNWPGWAVSLAGSIGVARESRDDFNHHHGHQGSHHHATTPRSASQTGLKKDGTPDMRTILGRSMQHQSDMYRTPQGSGLGGGLSGFVGSATRSWNGSTSGPMTAAGLPDMRFKANWA